MAKAKATLKVTGMTCQHCAATVTQALQGLEGVTKAKVNLRKGLAEVTYQSDKLNPQDLAQAVQRLGYEATLA